MWRHPDIGVSPDIGVVSPMFWIKFFARIWAGILLYVAKLIDRTFVICYVINEFE